MNKTTINSGNNTKDISEQKVERADELLSQSTEILIKQEPVDIIITSLNEDGSLHVTDQFSGQRIDKVLGELSLGVSRTAIQQWIKEGHVLVNDKPVKQTYRLLIDDLVSVDAPEITVKRIEDSEPENLPVNVIFEDDDIIIINKPAGLVVHPGAGNEDGTLMNAILFHWPESKKLPRAGIVHRLDKDTSGLMVLAKNEHARLNLVEQLSDRSLSREYLAVCLGMLISGATIKKPMRRDSHDRRKMAVCKSHEGNGKEAITHYRIEERFRKHTLVRVKLETGRTHQIRVHMTSAGYPLVGDPVYGKRLVIPKGCEPSVSELLRKFKRQALHATRLALVHPVSQKILSWEASIPDDMLVLTQALRFDCEQHK